MCHLHSYLHQKGANPKCHLHRICTRICTLSVQIAHWICTTQKRICTNQTCISAEICVFGANHLYEWCNPMHNLPQKWCKWDVQFAPKWCKSNVQFAQNDTNIWCIAPFWCKYGANCTWKMVQIAPGKRCKLHLENVRFAPAIAGVGVPLQWPHLTPSKAPNPTPSKWAPAGPSNPGPEPLKIDKSNPPKTPHRVKKPPRAIFFPGKFLDSIDVLGWHINNFSATPVTDPPGRVYPILPAGYPDENTYIPWVPRTQHINFWPLATGRETPGHPVGRPPPQPGQSPEKLFMFMCLFLSWKSICKNDLRNLETN